ncbi:MAG: galactose-1-epimerase, partial [Burkholderiaceae bacterium]
PFDFRQPRPIGAAIAALQATGARPATHDHCWVLDAPGEERAAAVLRAGDGLLGMALHTDAPGLQFYAGEFLPETLNRLGQPQVRHGGLALEPQCMPDSPNHPEWRQASCILRPGQVYRQRLVYRFFPADPA